MIDYLLLGFVRSLLWLRYRVKITGLETIAQRGRKGILFLPNHPALIDPIIVMSRLFRRFRARALADHDQIDRFFIRWLAKRARILPLVDMSKAGTVKGTREAIDRCAAALQGGDNLILYPGGRVRHHRYEDLRGNSGVETILGVAPDVRVVLVRTRGLWGSAFGWASGKKPSVGGPLKKGIKAMLASGLFFAPRRHVTMEFVEPDDFPRAEGRAEINRYLERFYNEGAAPNTYVPYSIWERGGLEVRPEPAEVGGQGDLSQVSPAVRQQVQEFLAELTGVASFADDARLAQDLGMDSLDLMEMVNWLQEEFGCSPASVHTLHTAGDVMLAASGLAVSASAQPLKHVPAKWFKHLPTPSLAEGLATMTIPQAFLAQARRWPHEVIAADQTSGARTFRELARAIHVLSKHIEAMDGQNVGIMMPASVGGATLYLATLFAGKTPAMINWTLGPGSLAHCVRSAGIKTILTSRMLLGRLESQGVVFGEVKDTMVFVEDIRKTIGRAEKVSAVFATSFGWRALRQRAERTPETAVILFTSGSENVPKAVPLTHQNILTNVADIYERFTIGRPDSLLGMLPPFHSFGLTALVGLPFALGLRVVYSPDPTDGATLAALSEAYRPTLLAGTPTFLEGIARASAGDEMRSLRLVISGAEKCSPRVYEILEQHCPHTTVLEGYGATECSPVIAVNHEDDPRAYTIGRPLASVQHAIVDPAMRRRVPTGWQGMLLVRGPSVFDGYLNYDGPSPFVTFEGESWYRTGDLVTEDTEGVLTFAGRLKRFVKLGGEMISLPAIEAALEAQFVGGHDEGPVLAVTSARDADTAEIVLFAATPVDRESANRAIREAGLSGLHNVRRVIRVDELPTLGSGKVDYRALEQRLAEGAAQDAGT